MALPKVEPHFLRASTAIDRLHWARWPLTAPKVGCELLMSFRRRASVERLVGLLRLDVGALLRHVFQYGACGGGCGMERCVGDERKVKKDVRGF